MRYRMMSPAEIELLAAIEYYHRERPGLGLEFALEVQCAICRIQEHPFAWTKLETDIRRCPVTRFPFSIRYLLEKQEIVIIAIMHHKRKPGYWRTRLSLS